MQSCTGIGLRSTANNVVCRLCVAVTGNAVSWCDWGSFIAGIRLLHAAPSYVILRAGVRGRIQQLTTVVIQAG